MADYYRNPMETGLREYATSIGKTYPSQLYKDLAWVGLQGTEAWNKMYSDKNYTKIQQDKIIKAINDFNNTGNNECE